MINSISHLPSKPHQIVFKFLIEHCQSAETFAEFGRLFYEKEPQSRHKKYKDMLNAGFVSKDQLLDFLRVFSDENSMQVGNYLGRIYQSLIDWDILQDAKLLSTAIVPDFRILFNLIKKFAEKDLLENIVKGPAIIPFKYEKSIAAIVVRNADGTEALGTGSLLRHNGCDIVITNKHVVDPSRGIKFERIHLAGLVATGQPTPLSIGTEDDLAAFAFAAPPQTPRFYLGDFAFLRQQVLLFGYPKIPRTTKPYLTTHSGEINATISTMDSPELFLISNYASPGSSGGPLTDYSGALVGVVSDSLEGKYEHEGIFQHSAAITLERLRRFVEVEALPTLF